MQEAETKDQRIRCISLRWHALRIAEVKALRSTRVHKERYAEDALLGARLATIRFEYTWLARDACNA